MTLIDKACYERGCACYDPRVDLDNIEVVQREWVGLTDEDVKDLCGEASNFGTSSWIRHIEAKLKEKNT